MNFIEQVMTVWRALLANKLRSFLTLLGVIMGVGTIVLLSSLVAGGLASIKRTVDSASGDDVLEVWVDTWAAKGTPPRKLDTADMRSLAGASGLAGTSVVPQLNDRTDVRANGEVMRARVVGTNEQALKFYQLEMARGRFLTASDRQDARRVAVIGPDVAKKFLSGRDGFGEIKIRDERFTVVGVLAKKPSLTWATRLGATRWPSRTRPSSPCAAAPRSTSPCRLRAVPASSAASRPGSASRSSRVGAARPTTPT